MDNPGAHKDKQALALLKETGVMVRLNHHAMTGPWRIASSRMSAALPEGK